MIPYFQALFIQRHGMISALMIYGISKNNKCLKTNKTIHVQSSVTHFVYVLICKRNLSWSAHFCLKWWKKAKLSILSSNFIKILKLYSSSVWKYCSLLRNTIQNFISGNDLYYWFKVISQMCCWFWEFPQTSIKLNHCMLHVVIRS